MIPNLKMQQAVEEAVRLTIQSFDGQIKALRKQAADDASELDRLTAERDEAREAFMRVAEAVGAPASERLDLEVRDRFARLTERAEKAETFALACELQITTAEAALTTLRADHAAEVARLTEALRFYADEDAWSGQPWRLQFESPGRDGHGSDTARDALATTEMGCSVPGVATSPKEA